MNTISSLISRRLFATTPMAQSRTRLEFFYDVTSPYTWFAFEVLMRYKKHWDVNIELKPFLLVGIGKLAGNSTPALVPLKARYMGQEDIPRLAKYFSVPLKMIADPMKSMFERGSLIPSHFLTAVDMTHPEYLESVTRALWMELWNKDEDITTPEVIVRAGKAGGLSEEQIRSMQEKANEQAVKDRLKEHTNLAFKYGAFGSPTIIAHHDGKRMLFFGSDRFPVLAMEIGEKWLGPNPNSPEVKL